MKTYKVSVIRKQAWTFDVEAETSEAAMDVAERMANDEPAHDDWAYDTYVVKRLAARALLET